MPDSPLPFMDALGAIARALIDSSRRLLVSVDAISISGGAVPVISTNGDKLIGYESGVSQNIVNLAHPAGNLTIVGATVPGGKVWVIDAVAAVDFTAGTLTTHLFVLSIVQPICIASFGPLAVNIRAFANGGPWVLSAGENIRVDFTGTGLNDNCQLWVHGYQSDAT